MKTLIVLIFISFIFSARVCAEEEKSWTDYQPGLVGSIILVESLVAFGSYVATYDPQMYALVGGAAIGQEFVKGFSNTKLWWSSLLAIEGLMLYNAFALDENKDSAIKIFSTNFIGWNVIGATFMASIYTYSRRNYTAIPFIDNTSNRFGITVYASF